MALMGPEVDQWGRGCRYRTGRKLAIRKEGDCKNLELLVCIVLLFSLKSSCYFSQGFLHKSQLPIKSRAGYFGFLCAILFGGLLGNISWQY